MIGDREKSAINNNGLTEKQNTIYLFIKDFMKSNQYSPSVREIASEYKISAPAIHDHMLCLKKKGFIDFKENQPRTIKILK